MGAFAPVQDERARRLWLSRSGARDQAGWNSSKGRAGARGGARAGKRKCVRILTITWGSTMAAMICKRAPQRGQSSISISNTRLSKHAQLMRAGACACAAGA